MLVRGNPSCSEPPLEEVARSVVAAIESLGVARLKPLHALAEIRLWSFEKEMNVIVH